MNIMLLYSITVYTLITLLFRFHVSICKTKTIIYLTSKRDARINLVSAGRGLQNGLSGLIQQITNSLFFY